MNSTRQRQSDLEIDEHNIDDDWDDNQRYVQEVHNDPSARPVNTHSVRLITQSLHNKQQEPQPSYRLRLLFVIPVLIRKKIGHVQVLGTFKTVSKP
jgi:hypothetical protein